MSAFNMRLTPIRFGLAVTLLIITCGLTTKLAAQVKSQAASQETTLIPDASIPIPALKFDSAGHLIIKPSATSSEHDFDYLIGNWKLKNRNLKSRLNHSTEWVEFESRVEMHQILNGIGNIDRYTESRDGKKMEGVALRLFDPKTRLWSIYWADSVNGKLDPPVVGSFENRIGHFFGEDTYRGQPIIFLFRWDVRNPNAPVWSQAFSADQGKTWEWNAFNVSIRDK